jgi:glycosyltransferase involved in cell wall biosynthesis
MNVLHVIPAVAARYGGPSHAVLGMGRALAHQRVDVLIATTDADGPGRLPVEPEAPQSWQGVPTIFFPRQWSEGFKYSRPLARWLGQHVLDFQVVHIHAVFSHACLAAAHACRLSRIPYVVRPLGTLDPWSLRQKPVRKRLLWHFGASQMLREAAAVHYTTTAEQCLAETPLALQRGVVIPLGVDAEYFDDPENPNGGGPAEGHPYVLMLGRLHPKKGMELLVDVFLQFASHPESKDWRLVIAGDGDAEYVANFKQLVHSRGGDDKILLSGWLGGVRKAAALRGAALLALPSRQENFGLVVAESLACGTPVLVSDQVNLADQITAANAGWVVPLERARLFEALCEALGNTDERVRRGAAGRELARARFKWDVVAAQLGQLYSNLAGA